MINCNYQPIAAGKVSGNLHEQYRHVRKWKVRDVHNLAVYVSNHAVSYIYAVTRVWRGSTRRHSEWTAANLPLITDVRAALRSSMLA